VLKISLKYKRIRVKLIREK